MHLVLDKTTKRSKAMAFVLYMIPECAVRYCIACLAPSFMKGSGISKFKECLYLV